MSLTLNMSEILSSYAPWAYLAVCMEEEIDDFVFFETERKSNVIFRIVRGQRSSSKDLLLQEWAAALQFPYYFGHNWDAFHECIRDLKWLRGNGYIFFVTHAENILLNSSNDFKIFLEILRDSSEEWAIQREQAKQYDKSTIPFRVIFHCEPSNRVFCEKRFTENDVKFKLVL